MRQLEREDLMEQTQSIRSRKYLNTYSQTDSTGVVELRLASKRICSGTLIPALVEISRNLNTVSVVYVGDI